MPGLVEQIQLDAMNPAVPVATLLRKVKVAAVKLGLSDTLSWVEQELAGYSDDLPEYRMGRGQTVGYNPYHGWQPVAFQDHETADLVATVNFYEPIGNYEQLLEKGEGPFHIPLPNSMLSLLNETFNFQVPKAANTISRGLIVQIVDRVRDLVLDWALELARAGISGDGLGFSSEERTIATGAQISIGTFHGSFNSGDASGPSSLISQNSNFGNFNSSAEVFNEINRAVEVSEIDEKTKDKIRVEIDEMRRSPNLESFIRNYNKFIEVSANHITLMAPFLPALTKLMG